MIFDATSFQENHVSKNVDWIEKVLIVIRKVTSLLEQFRKDSHEYRSFGCVSDRIPCRCQCNVVGC